MEFNVNVNVRLGFDEKAARIAELLVEGLRNCEYALQDENQVPPAITRVLDKASETLEDIKSESEAPIEEPSDLPFDNDANSEAEAKPLPFVAIWTPEDARKARKKKMDEIEASVAPTDKENVHKQMVKLTKNFLSSAAYKHERNEMGYAINNDGLLVKKLDELDSDETLRFMYLCESMFYSAEYNEVFPSEGLDEVLEACKDWEQVERDFVKTYNKK